MTRCGLARIPSTRGTTNLPFTPGVDLACQAFGAHTAPPWIGIICLASVIGIFVWVRNSDRRSLGALRSPQDTKKTRSRGQDRRTLAVALLIHRTLQIWAGHRSPPPKSHLISKPHSLLFAFSRVEEKALHLLCLLREEDSVDHSCF